MFSSLGASRVIFSAVSREIFSSSGASGEDISFFKNILRKS
jgi:hypothetical protein